MCIVVSHILNSHYSIHWRNTKAFIEKKNWLSWNMKIENIPKYHKLKSERGESRDSTFSLFFSLPYVTGERSTYLVLCVVFYISLKHVCTMWLLKPAGNWEWNEQKTFYYVTEFRLLFFQIAFFFLFLWCMWLCVGKLFVEKIIIYEEEKYPKWVRGIEDV